MLSHHIRSEFVVNGEKHARKWDAIDYGNCLCFLIKDLIVCCSAVGACAVTEPAGRKDVGEFHKLKWNHHNDVIMSAMSSQITTLTIVYSTVYLGADQRKHQSSALLGSVRGIHWWPVNCPHKGPVTRKIFPFGDAIMIKSPIVC